MACKLSSALIPFLMLAAAVFFSLSQSLVQDAKAEAAAAVPSAYEELRRSGFPPGLLPANVLRYALNRTTGEFSVDLGDRCRVTLPPDNYPATYSQRVTGRLLDRRIAELDGIRVRAFFRWWSITGIRSSGDDLVFEVGVASAKYPSRNFNESLACEGRSQY